MADNELVKLILITTAIFLIAPTFIIIYVILYNQRKKKHIEEKASMQQNFDAELVKTQLEVQEQTMQTIGADLHDNIGQLLSLTALTLGSVELDDAEKATQKIDDALSLNSRCIKELRLLGKLLQGEQLISAGLSEAIDQEIAWMEKSGQYLIIYTTENLGNKNSNADKDLLVFRILQEIMNNIMKHAFATKIIIELHCHEKNLYLTVEDNGVGFYTDGVPGKQEGMGLQNIRKRAALMSGAIKIESRPDSGTLVELQIPYP